MEYNSKEMEKRLLKSKERLDQPQSKDDSELKETVNNKLDIEPQLSKKKSDKGFLEKNKRHLNRSGSEEETTQ